MEDVFHAGQGAAARAAALDLVAAVADPAFAAAAVRIVDGVDGVEEAEAPASLESWRRFGDALLPPRVEPWAARAAGVEGERAVRAIAG